MAKDTVETFKDYDEFYEAFHEWQKLDPTLSLVDKRQIDVGNIRYCCILSVLHSYEE